MNTNLVEDDVDNQWILNTIPMLSNGSNWISELHKSQILVTTKQQPRLLSWVKEVITSMCD